MIVNTAMKMSLRNWQEIYDEIRHSESVKGTGSRFISYVGLQCFAHLLS